MQPSRLLARLLAFLLAAAGIVLVGAVAPPVHADPDDGGAGRVAGKSATVVDVTLGGTVSTPDGAPLDGGVNLYQWDSSTQFFEYYDGVPLEDPSGAATYAFLIPPGSYYVEAYDNIGDYQPTFSGGGTETPVDLDSPGVLAVDSTEVTADIELVPLATQQQVTGTVVDGDGAPVADVYLETVSGPDYGDATTDAGGTFVMSLLPGTYQVHVYAPDAFENTTVEIVVDADGGALDPIVLTPAGQWTVTGSVQDADGPLADADVQVVRLAPDGSGGWFEDDWIGFATTQGDGTFSVSGIRSGDEYTIRATAPGYAARYGGSVASLDDPALEHVLLKGDHAFAPVTLPLASTLDGVVTGPDGPEADASVELYQWDDGEQTFYEVDSTVTGDTGAYEFSSIEPGIYTLYFEPGQASVAAPAWLGGATMPTATDAPGVFEVGSTPTAYTKDKTLARAQLATGRITDESGNPLSDGGVVVYRWDPEFMEWSQFSTGTTGADGTYAVRLPAVGDTVTLRYSRGGFRPRFLGGGESLPATFDSNNSRQVPATGDLALPDAKLPLFVSHLGKIAGQDELDWCRTNLLPANDDDSSDQVTLPFDLKFYGNAFSSLYVNNNGNVTFGNPLSEFTPSALNGPTEQPIIAPFFADVDTSGAGSNVVTYGASPDGKSFCVNWADVGYYDSHDDKLNTFQLVLTSRTGAAGRSTGDFDIRFNYDELLWETGDASDGANGFGGTSAAAGFSAGTGEPGSFVQLDGSLVNGALLDGGPDALVASSQNSVQPGRYNFEVRNDGFQSTLGGLTGHVQTTGGAAVAGAYVEVCRTGTYLCSYTETTAGGDYTFTALNAGGYAVEVWPPNGNLLGGGTTATVTSGNVTTAPVVVLAAPVPMPDNVQLNGAVADGGVPSVYYGDPVHLRVTGCPGLVAPTYTVALTTGQVLRNHLALVETSPGVYEADIAPFMPDHGDAVISTTVPKTCGGQPTTFNVYIDPAGVVTDQWGRPIAGATVTLSRADSAEGPFSTVPDGSDIMSVSNRVNPFTTAADGMFQWNVIAGFYKVAASAPDCGSTTTGAMQIAPERTHLVLKLTCGSASPPVAAAHPSITGVAKAGQTITAVGTTWEAPLQDSVALYRNGVSLGVASYQLKASDVGAEFRAVSTGVRPPAQSDDGPDGASLNTLVTFASVTAQSAPVIAAAADPAPPQQQPVATTTVLTGKKKVKAGKRPFVTVTVTAAGVVPTGVVTVRAGAKVLGTGTLVNGVVKIKLKKLKKTGKVTLVATYGGSATAAASTSAPLKVKVR